MAEATVLESSPLLGIVRFHDGGDVSGAVEALVSGGIELVEVTIDTPGALAAVERAAGDGRVVGVGTVVSVEQVRACAAAGAPFVVLPGLIAGVVRHARGLGVRTAPGVLSAAENLPAGPPGGRPLQGLPAPCRR